MDLRETINKNSKYAVVVVAIAVLAAVIVIFRQLSGGTSGGVVAAVVFTTDEKTWFTDDPKKLAPFDKDGKQAVRAHVFKCEDGTTFIGYLERFTPAAKVLLEKVNKDPNSLTNEEKGQYMSISVTGKEIKRPGDKAWSRATGAPLGIKCPDGQFGTEIRD